MRQIYKMIILVILLCFSFLGCEQKNQLVDADEETVKDQNEFEFEYKLVGKRGKCEIIYTDTESLEELEKLSQKYKDEHKDMKIIQLMFFNDEELAKESANIELMSDAQLISWFATYNYNANTGHEDISRTMHDVVIEQPE